MELSIRYPLGSLLIARYVDNSNRFFRVVGHTAQKVRVNQIVPFRKRNSKYRVDETCRLVAENDNRVKYKGLAKVKDNGLLVWAGWTMCLWPNDSFDEDDPFVKLVLEELLTE